VVKLGPDLFDGGSDNYAGYSSTGSFSGFSMMHEQGTGGAPKYGTMAQLPLVGDVADPLSNLTVGRAAPDQGAMGYYQAHTSQNVVVELAATSHAGMYQYTFPAGSSKNNILVDVSHVLPSFRTGEAGGLGQEYQGGEFSLYPDGHYEASGTYNMGWNRSPDWTVYSCKRTSSTLS
jgi:putative alpha-1,2-mannosidase